MGAADGFTDSGELDGLTVYDNEGEKVGSVGRVYVDDDTGKPDWVTVKTGMFGMKESFEPLAGARPAGSTCTSRTPRTPSRRRPAWTRTRTSPSPRRRSSTGTTAYQEVRQPR
ncbi:hypothetical protein SMICM17S_09178 [Streptomyces microflavus]